MKKRMLLALPVLMLGLAGCVATPTDPGPQRDPNPRAPKPKEPDRAGNFEVTATWRNVKTRVHFEGTRNGEHIGGSPADVFRTSSGSRPIVHRFNGNAKDKVRVVIKPGVSNFKFGSGPWEMECTIIFSSKGQPPAFRSDPTNPDDPPPLTFNGRTCIYP